MINKFENVKTFIFYYVKGRKKSHIKKYMYSFTDFVLILTVITNDITEKEISVLIPYEQIKNDQDLSFWVGKHTLKF